VHIVPYVLALSPIFLT